MFVHRLKLRPPEALPIWLERPGIERRFHAGISVLAVVAGPGYGKTVFAAQIFHRWEGPKLWYSLDESDGDLAAFSAHLDAMVSAQAARPLAGDAWHLGSPKEIGSRVAEVLAEVRPSPLLVFDDVHFLDGSRALPALAELIERGVKIGATFVLCGRSMPVPLHGIAATARLARAGAVDLAFDEAESLRYLEFATNLRGDRSLLQLARRAEGWPAGLALAATTSSNGRGVAPDSLSARDDETRRLLFDYLASEVLEGLAENERSLLTATSILDELEIDLCNSVLGRSDSAEILASLARRGLFVSRRSDDAYTVHQLFREFLRHHLMRTAAPGEVAALHRRASQALATRGDLPYAILHLLDAGDDDAAAEALEKAAFSMLSAGLLSQVASFLQRIGEARIGASATLLIALGRVQNYRGDLDRALASYERAIALARTEQQLDVMAEAVRVSSPILAGRGEYQRLSVLLAATLAMGAQLSEASVTGLKLSLGGLYLDTERFDEAVATFSEIMPSVVARGDLPIQGIVLHNTAVAHVRRGDPYAGLAMYERALKIKRSAGQRVAALMTLANMIYALRVLGDIDEAERLTAQLLDDANDIGNALMVAFAHENDGALKAMRGDVEAAHRAYREAQRACDPGDVVVLPDILHGLAQCALNLGNLAEGDDLCARAANVMRATNRRQASAPVGLTRAECALARGDFSIALATARDALEAAAQGVDPLTQAASSVDAAALLMRIAPHLGQAEAAEAERLASEAATTAVALVHQRDYRFLLRTKSRAFSELHDHLRRWKIGAGLLPDVGALRGPVGLRIEMLGGLRVYVGGEPIPAEAWKRRRARDIFAYLVSLRGRSVPRSRLVDLYWPETDADAAHDNLRVTISAIRKALGDVVKFEANGYRFVPPHQTVVDIEQFDLHVDAARQAVARGDLDEARRRFMQSSELYRGEFLDGLEDGGWQWRERERLRAACLETLRWLAHDREGDQSIRRLALDRLLEIAPFDLDALRMRLDVMVEEARLADARREYDDWRDRYRCAVGVEAPDIWTPGGNGTKASVLRLSH